MRYLEVRRHTMRTKPGEHLSQAGVDLARRVGEGMDRSTAWSQPSRPGLSRPL